MRAPPIDTGAELAERKRALRTAMRALPRPAAGEAARAADAVATAITSAPAFASAHTVALYAALADEIPVRPLFERALEAGKACALPRATAAGGLEFARVGPGDWEQLVRGPHGALEPPPEAEAVALQARDLVLVPGLAFDRRGGRLGRGGGHYDRAFASLAARSGPLPILCGVTYAARVVGSVPVGPLDRRVDALATERGWLACEGGRCA